MSTFCPSVDFYAFFWTVLYRVAMGSPMIYHEIRDGFICIYRQRIISKCQYSRGVIIVEIQHCAFKLIKNNIKFGMKKKVSISVCNWVSLYYLHFKASFGINMHSSEVHIPLHKQMSFCIFHLLVLGISNTICINGKHGFSLWQTWRVVNLANSCLPSSFPQI